MTDGRDGGHNLGGLPWLTWVWVLCFIFAGCGSENDTAVQVLRVPESYQFMGIGANTVINSSVRDRLKADLGPYAVNRSSPIDLELRYRGFLKRYYPDLARLNQRLNVNDVVRKEYPATQLTFRNTRQKNTVFDYVELIYAHASDCPLLIKMTAKKDIPDLIKSVKEKYGRAEKTPISNGKSWSLSWRKKGDMLLIARMLGRYDRSEYHMMIVYINRIEKLLARSKKGRPSGEKSVDNIFE